MDKQLKLDLQNEGEDISKSSITDIGKNSIYPSIHPSIHPSIYLSICIHIYMYIYVYIYV
jgi:hypothetical protein